MLVHSLVMLVATVTANRLLLLPLEENMMDMTVKEEDLAPQV